MIGDPHHLQGHWSMVEAAPLRRPPFIFRPSRWPTVLLLGGIWLYRAAISPFLGPGCRFTPSCAIYGRDAVRRYGARHGGWMMIKRLLRCHPFHPGGWDPVV